MYQETMEGCRITLRVAKYEKVHPVGGSCWRYGSLISHRAGCPVPKLLLVVFAGQLLEQLVGGTLDIPVVFRTSTLFGSDEGAAM